MKIKKTAAGEPLIRAIRVRVFNAENKGSKLITVRAAPGRGWTDADIEKFLDHAAGEVDKNRPREDFEMVQVAPGQFNFVWRRWREGKIN